MLEVEGLVGGGLEFVRGEGRGAGERGWLAFWGARRCVLSFAKRGRINTTHGGGEGEVCKVASGQETSRGREKGEREDQHTMDGCHGPTKAGSETRARQAVAVSQREGGGRPCKKEWRCCRSGEREA